MTHFLSSSILFRLIFHESLPLFTRHLIREICDVISHVILFWRSFSFRLEVFSQRAATAVAAVRVQKSIRLATGRSWEKVKLTQSPVERENSVRLKRAISFSLFSLWRGEKIRKEKVNENYLCFHFTRRLLIINAMRAHTHTRSTPIAGWHQKNRFTPLFLRHTTRSNPFSLSIQLLDNRQREKHFLLFEIVWFQFSSSSFLFLVSSFIQRLTFPHVYRFDKANQ